MRYVWTAEKKARLDELLKSGMTYQKIADEFGMSLSSLWRMFHKSEAKQPRKKKWTEKDDEQFIRLYESGMGLAAIGKALGTTEMTVRNHAGKLEEAGRIKLKKRNKWTPELKSRLIELTGKGIKYEDIAKELGMSYSAVVNSAMRLVEDGVINRRRARSKM